ncbi:MAG: hypothetical protein OHK0039_42380 [Bacteroidia bacterium]
MNKYSACILACLLVLGSAYGQCGDTTHTAAPDDTWTSCQTAPNPHATRGSGHWIMYDLGHVYTLQGSHVWNANATGETDKGFRDVLVDYSLDGTQWTELGSFTFARASGYDSYTGSAGPDFGGRQARYVLLTAQSNWGHAQCYGLAEVRFGLSAVTAIDLEAQASQLEVYPNPATDWLSVDWGDLRPQVLRLVSIEGRILQQYDGLVPQRIAVSALPAGIYFLSIQDQAGQYHSRGFIKQ